MGGFMPTPAAPAQPPTVKLDTTALSRGNFNNFLKNMSGASSLNPPMAPQMGAMMSPSLAPSISDIDIFNPPMQMMQEGGNVAPRQTEIMGQPHMLAYITPQEGDILESLGGANKPGPMGIPSFYPGEGDSSAGVDGPSGEADGGASSDPGGTGADDGVSDDDSDNTDYSDFSDNTDYSDPDSDMDYTDSYSTTQDQEDDFSAATAIGQAVAAANAQSGKGRTNITNVGKDSNLAYSPQFAADVAQAQGLDPSVTMSPEDYSMTTQGKEAQAQMDDAMAINQAMNQAPAATNIAAAFSNIGAKGIDQDPLGLDLTGVGLGPSINAPSIASVSPTSGPNTNADITGFGSSRDKSDFSTDIDALSNIEDQAKKGSFPSFDNVPGTLGAITSLINAATKTGAQNTLDNIAKGFAPTYDKDGNITGTTNYGIGMGQPGNDTDMTGGFFSSGRSVDGYDVFDKTSPSLGMYDDNTIGGDESDSPIILPRTPKPEEEKSPTNIGMMGGANPFAPTQMPVVVDSPFTTSVGDFQGTGFNTGDLNRLIAQITGIQSPRSMAQGGIAGFADGGLIKAVDDFLSTGQ